MTKREKEAKIKATEAELNDVKKHRKPSGREDSLAVESMSVEQGYREKNEELKVLNSRDAVITLSETSVKVISGGYEEVNGKEKKDNEEPEK